jgi:hypothetical protein
MRIDGGSVPVFIAHLHALAGGGTLFQGNRAPDPRPAGPFVTRYSREAVGKTAIADDELQVCQAISRALRAEVGSKRHADKLVAQAVAASPRTAKGWLREESAPQAAKLIRLMAEYDAVFDVVLELAGRARPGELSMRERDVVAEALRIIEARG